MKLAIISDTHDNIWKLESALQLMASAGAVLHCGDLCSPFVVELIAAAVPSAIPVHIIWGNNEGDIRLICTKASKYPNLILHGHFAELTVGDHKIAMTHYPEVARPLASSGCYHLVCYGHDHTAHHERLGSCILLNPGDIMGLNGRSTFAWYETSDATVQFVEIT